MNPVRTALRFAFVAVLAAGCGSTKMRDPEQRGAAEAFRDISSGEAHLAFLGTPAPWTSPLDTETGLLRWPHGCEVSSESLSYLRGYNDAVMTALREGRLAGQTYAEKATTREALESRFRSDEPTTLTLGGASATSPGGRFRVEIAPRRHPQAPTDETPYFFVTDTTTGVRAELHYVGGGSSSARVMFDHGGTTLIVRDAAWDAYSTFDLPRRTVLQRFEPLERR